MLLLVSLPVPDIPQVLRYKALYSVAVATCIRAVLAAHHHHRTLSRECAVASAADRSRPAHEPVTTQPTRVTGPGKTISA